MKAMAVWTALLCACGSESGDLGAPRQATPSSSTSASASTGAGGEAGSGGQGGQGGHGGQPPCDPWDKTRGAPECCVVHPQCPEGVLGVCLVDVRLCNGVCRAAHVNPVPGAPCEGGGKCNDEGVCVLPEPMGGAGGVGGDGDGGGQ